MMVPLASGSRWPLPRLLLRAGAGGIRLEEHTHRHLRRDLSVMLRGLLELERRNSGQTRQPLKLLEKCVVTVEVAGEAHLNRLLAVVGGAGALGGLDGSRFQRVGLGLLPDVL